MWIKQHIHIYHKHKAHLVDCPFRKLILVKKERPGRKNVASHRLSLPGRVCKINQATIVPAPSHYLCYTHASQLQQTHSPAINNEIHFSCGGRCHDEFKKGRNGRNKI